MSSPPRRRILTTLALVPLATLATYAGGCGEEEETRDTSFEVDRVTFEGQATQAALYELLARKGSISTAETTVFDAPSASSTLSANAPPKLRWHVQAASARRAPLGVPAAFAHDAPVNGRVYFLVFSSGGEAIFGIFTTSLDTTPSAEDWALLADEQQPIEVSMLSGVLTDGALVSGPFLGKSVSFTIS